MSAVQNGTYPRIISCLLSHKGNAQLHFDLAGLAAHSSQPHLGHNALLAAASLMLAFDDEHKALQTMASPLGAPTLTPTMASGGVALNIVPPHARVSVDRRIVVGERAADVCENLAAFACKHVQAHNPHIAVEAKASFVVRARV